MNDGPAVLMTSDSGPRQSRQKMNHKSQLSTSVSTTFRPQTSPVNEPDWHSSWPTTGLAQPPVIGSCLGARTEPTLILLSVELTAIAATSASTSLITVVPTVLNVPSLRGPFLNTVPTSPQCAAVSITGWLLDLRTAGNPLVQLMKPPDTWRTIRSPPHQPGTSLNRIPAKKSPW